MSKRFRLIDDAEIIASANGKFTMRNLAVLARKYKLTLKQACETLEDNGLIDKGHWAEFRANGGTPKQVWDKLKFTEQQEKWEVLLAIAKSMPQPLTPQNAIELAKDHQLDVSFVVGNLEIYGLLPKDAYLNG